jgi:ankyrin repeat protein
MFPNPQDALPLPPRPSLERYKKLAKELVKACNSAEPSAIRNWSEAWVEALVKLSDLRITRDLSVRMQSWIDEVEEFGKRKLLGGEPTGRRCALAAAQFVIARSHGFESWPKFANQLEALVQKNSSVSRFEAAADAIVSGDVATLKRLLSEEPELIRARSTREHGATLLHYVSANGVEGYRQKTPKNIVEITEMLLNAGAEIDAMANLYGGCTTLGLAATSVHPERASVQDALLQTLLDHAAKLEQPSSGGNRKSLVTACLANGRMKAAEFLASRGARLDLAGAAGLGRLDVVKSFFDEDGSLKPNASKEQLEEGFLFACGHGGKDVAEFLLGRGVDLAAQSDDGQTALHRAVTGGHIHTAKLLLSHGAPLEAKNIYGGTALDQTLWSAAHGGDPEVYIAILEALVAAGAKMPERHVPVNTRVNAWLARHGSRAEPSWHWYGEKPRREKPSIFEHRDVP